MSDLDDSELITELVSSGNHAEKVLAESFAELLTEPETFVRKLGVTGASAVLRDPCKLSEALGMMRLWGFARRRRAAFETRGVQLGPLQDATVRAA